MRNPQPTLVSINKYSTIFAKFNKDHSATRKEFAEFTLIVIQISVYRAYSRFVPLLSSWMDAPLRQIFATQSTRWPVKFVLRLAWKPAQTFRATFPWLFLGNSGRNQRFPCVRNSPLVPRNTFLWTAKWHPSSVAMHQPILPRTTFLALGTTVPVTANLSNLPQLRSS